MARTRNAGDVRHSELRSDATVIYTTLRISTGKRGLDVVAPTWSKTDSQMSLLS